MNIHEHLFFLNNFTSGQLVHTFSNLTNRIVIIHVFPNPKLKIGLTDKIYCLSDWAPMLI